MSNKFVGCLLIVLMLAVVDLSHATVYYSDFVSGNDSNNGTSQATPWKRLPGMDNEAVVPNFVAGDIVCLKGGVTWPDRIIAVDKVSYYSVGGSAIAQSVCAGFGSGKAIIDWPAQNSFGAFRVTGPKTGLVVDGIQAIFREVGANTANTVGAFYFEGTSGNLIQNVVIRNSSGTLSANGIVLAAYVNNFTIMDSDFSGNLGNTAQAACNGSGIVLSNSGSTPNVTNIFIRRTKGNNNGLTCYNGSDSEGRGITLQNEGSNVLIEDSSFNNNGGSPDGAAIDAGGYNNVVLLRNVFNGYTAAEIKANANNWTIYGNTFIGTSTAPFQYGYFGSDSIGSVIENNTITSKSSLSTSPMWLSSPGTNMAVRNNTINCPSGNTTAAIIFDKTGTSWSQTSWDNAIDANIVRGCSYFSNEKSSGGNTLRTLPQHQAAYPNQMQGSAQY